MEWNYKGKQFHRKYLGLKEQCHEDNFGNEDKLDEGRLELKNCHEFNIKKIFERKYEF